MKSTNFLMQEHKFILRALDVLDAISASAERHGKLDEGDAVRVLDFLCWFGDAHHQAKEEEILFPALKGAAAAQKRPVQHMILEHEQERALIEQLQTAVSYPAQTSSVPRSGITFTKRTRFFLKSLVRCWIPPQTTKLWPG